MIKRKINMIGGGFQHDICSSSGSTPKFIQWVKGDNSADISIHVDYGIMNIVVNKSKNNYAWLSESKTINLSLYQWCASNVIYLENNFELIFTHDIELLKLSPKFKLVVCSAKPWVKDIGLHNKTKLVSMIASNKIMCQEHLYRQEIIAKYRDKIDIFGRGFNEISTKELGLKDYHFSVTMENHTYPLAYSEKISDCFATGTIPIYYGTNMISDVFNGDGIIMLDKNFDINSLTPELYYSKIEAVKDNLNRVIEMPIAEDYIFEKYIK